MFDGVTSKGRPFRVPCQIIAPLNPQAGRGLLLFDWLVPSTIPTAVGQEQADARYTLTDDFLFGNGMSYATVRCDPAGIGTRSLVSNPSRPWSDGLLDTSTEFITSAGDEFDVIVLDAHKTRHEESNYRVYQFAGASHIRNIDVAEFGLPDPEDANPADWVPFFRALFVAGDRWCDGIAPPPSIWLGAPNDPAIARDAKGNALVRYVGGQPVNTTAFRLPEVAVGENQYIPLDPSYDDGSLLGFLRMAAGSHVDLTGSFTNHNQYVSQVSMHACWLEAGGYLLSSDANAIVQRAILSGIGN